jgi:hypothetical protein
MLPKVWHGTWRGTLEIVPPLKNYPAKVAMELRIGAAGEFALVYDGAVRPYTLEAAPGDPGHVTLDEHNGITMDGFLDGDTLHFAFEVEGTLLVTRYTLASKTLRYEVRTYKPAGVQNKVTSMRHGSVQRATLKRA